MGKKDTITKNYLMRPDIFADVFNQFLYHGRQKIEGRLEGELIGVIHAYQNMKVSPEDAKSYIMEEYKKSEEETNELLEKYWK